jgi:hypothetical protein
MLLGGEMMGTGQKAYLAMTWTFAVRAPRFQLCHSNLLQKRHLHNETTSGITVCVSWVMQWEHGYGAGSCKKPKVSGKTWSPVWTIDFLWGKSLHENLENSTEPGSQSAKQK